MSNAPAPVPVERWPGLAVAGPVSHGARSQVWRGRLAGRAVAIRLTKRTVASLEWELKLLVALGHAGFVVPTPIPTDDGQLHWEGWNVQSWIEGQEPSSADDWQRVAAELRRIHRRFRQFEQRPGASCVLDLPVTRRSVDADLDKTPDAVVEQCLRHFDPYLESQRSLIHGDLHPGNIRLTPSGHVGFLDWDEARVDIADLDLSNLGFPVLSGRRREAAEAAAHAWEALNGWLVEPAYARGRLAQLPPVVAPAAGIALSDERLHLRPRSLDDVPAQLEGEDDEIRRWLTGGAATIERVSSHISNLTRCWAADGLRHNFGIYLADRGGPLVGNLDINLADLDLDLNEANLSYAVFGPWRGNGHATAAVTLGVRHLRRFDPQLRPTLKIDRNNTASIAVAESAGFVPVRTVQSEGPLLSIWQQP